MKNFKLASVFGKLKNAEFSKLFRGQNTRETVGQLTKILLDELESCVTVYTEFRKFCQSTGEVLSFEQIISGWRWEIAPEFFKVGISPIFRYTGQKLMTFWKTLLD